MSTPIDRDTLAELQAQAGADFVAELVDTFAAEGPSMFDELQRALKAGADVDFRRAAHSIKSNGRTFGAMQLAEAARALELGALPADGGAIAALRAEFDRTIAALREAIRA